MVPLNLTEKSRCLKCGTLTLEWDAEGDLHCWGCGATFFPRSFHLEGGQSLESEVVHLPKRHGYQKVASKAPQVIELYNSGYGVRSIACELSMAVGSVRAVVKANGHLVDHQAARKKRKDRVKRCKQSIILALKGLAGAAKRNQYSYEQLLERARNLLSLYMEHDPQGTVASLSDNGNRPAAGDLVRRACEVVTAQRARLSGRVSVKI